MRRLLRALAALYTPAPACGPLCRDVAREVDLIGRAQARH